MEQWALKEGWGSFHSGPVYKGSVWTLPGVAERERQASPYLSLDKNTV